VKDAFAVVRLKAPEVRDLMAPEPAVPQSRVQTVPPAPAGLQREVRRGGNSYAHRRFREIAI